MIQDVLTCMWTEHNLEQANRLAPQGYLHIHAKREASVVPLPLGNWSDVACTCTCVAEFLDNQPGESRADVHIHLFM